MPPAAAPPLPCRVDKASDLHAPSWRDTLREVGCVVQVPSFLIIVLQASVRCRVGCSMSPQLPQGHTLLLHHSPAAHPLPCVHLPPSLLLTNHASQQGIVGTTPWVALVFLTLYFQLLGMSDLTASLLMATFLACNALGESTSLHGVLWGMLRLLQGTACQRCGQRLAVLWTCLPSCSRACPPLLSLQGAWLAGCWAIGRRSAGPTTAACLCASSLLELECRCQCCCSRQVAAAPAVNNCRACASAAVLRGCWTDWQWHLLSQARAPACAPACPRRACRCTPALALWLHTPQCWLPRGSPSPGRLRPATTQFLQVGEGCAAACIQLQRSGCLILSCLPAPPAEIVPSHLRNLVYAFDRSFEGAIAALGAPLVGWLAKLAFGFTGSAEVGPDAAENRRKAASLGNALLVFTAVPWALCATFFSGLHWSYPRDKRAAERQAAEAHAEALLLAEAAAEAAEPAGAGGGSAAGVELVAGRLGHDGSSNGGGGIGGDGDGCR